MFHGEDPTVETEAGGVISFCKPPDNSTPFSICDTNSTIERSAEGMARARTVPEGMVLR